MCVNIGYLERLSIYVKIICFSNISITTTNYWLKILNSFAQFFRIKSVIGHRYGRMADHPSSLS